MGGCRNVQLTGNRRGPSHGVREPMISWSVRVLLRSAIDPLAVQRPVVASQD